MSAPGDRPLAPGALISISAAGTKRSLPFQFNPESLRRTLEPNTVGGQRSQRSQAVRFAGAPIETITMDCRFAAAADTAGATASAAAAAYGVAPQLAALALLTYPASADIQRLQALLDAGTIEVTPPPADRLLLVWGRQWTLPCRLVGFSVVEQMYDAELRPVLATVTLTLRSLSYSDVDSTNPSFHEFFAYQQALERLAAISYQQGGTAPAGQDGAP